jgi:hypothetical protein
VIQETKVTSFESYISEINKIKKEFWFRGVINKNYSLIPGSVRHDLNGWKEISAVLDFMASYQNYHEKIGNHWELYSLMQHYGFPTRLLDWSTSMIVALYFALDGEPDKDDNGNEIERVVWAMTTGVINNFTFIGARQTPTTIGKATGKGEKYLPSPLRRQGENDSLEFEINPMAIRMPSTNKRVNAQKGCFTIHGSNPKGIEEVMIENGIESELFKFVFDEVAANQMRESLHRMQINEDDIYQDLNSLSKRIIRQRKVGIAT